MLRSGVLACVAGLFVAGCSLDLGVASLAGGGGTPSGALLVGDEPFAVRAGASVLSQGGSAVDAVTATYFALAVTYPAAAGLGGGGICIVHDAVTGRNEEFDFLARDASGGGPFAVPGNVRGFAMMQNAYGALPWQRDISPGEGYAAAGFPISRALAARLTDALDIIRLDASLAAEFLDESGKVKPEGAEVSNSELAQTLAVIRVKGPEGFYKGEVGARIIAYSQSQGGGIGVPELAGYPAMEGVPQVVQMGDAFVSLPSQRTGAGAFAGTLLENLNRAQSGDLQASLVNAVKETLGRFAITNLPSDLGATGFAAIDAKGQAAACAVTMNGPFGSGHSATGTGITLARAPSSGQVGVASAFLTPVIATRGSGGSVSLAGAGAGGPNGTAAIGYALARLARGEVPASPSDIRSYDTVNAIACQSGTCVALPDPAGHGIGLSADSVP